MDDIVVGMLLEGLVFRVVADVEVAIVGVVIFVVDVVLGITLVVTFGTEVTFGVGPMVAALEVTSVGSAVEVALVDDLMESLGIDAMTNWVELGLVMPEITGFKVVVCTAVALPAGLIKVELIVETFSEAFDSIGIEECSLILDEFDEFDVELTEIIGLIVVVTATASVVELVVNTISLWTLGSLTNGILSNCRESPKDSPLVISGLGFLGRLIGSELELVAVC